MLIPLRIQSPSSIKTYKQCPRKYYYQYIAKLPVISNIHQVRGSVVHEVLENFFRISVEGLNDSNFQQLLHLKMQDLLLESWQKYAGQFNSLNLSSEQIMLYFEESMSMLSNYLRLFFSKIASSGRSFLDAWNALIPLEQEGEYVSPSLSVKGFIDVVEKVENEIRLMDYKTDREADIEKHVLQLAIYALLYKEKHGVLPSKVGIYFLNSHEHHLDVDDALLDFARREIELIHQKTHSFDKKDYPKHISYLCKWSTGQCDFYDVCFNED